MCVILPLSQAFAIDGGPDYGSAQVRTTGIYAGVLFPKPVDIGGGVTTTDNSLGLFTLSVPRNGLATGTAAVFRNGLYYPGTITGTADPDTAKLTSVMNATFTRTVAQSITTGSGGTQVLTFVYTYNANGGVNGHIVANRNIFSTASARVTGKASVTYSNTGADPQGESGGPIIYRISGFKQSEGTSIGQ
jgi:hypothetical protein